MLHIFMHIPCIYLAFLIHLDISLPISFTRRIRFQVLLYRKDVKWICFRAIPVRHV